jgi:outer membrane protein assembly factor BamB
MAIRPGGTGDVTATHVVWKHRSGGPYIPSGVLYRNRLYLVSDHGIVSCYNAGDGNRTWRKRLRGDFTASLLAADGRIYATSELGDVYVFAAADSFKLLAKNSLGERCLATPAIAGGELFFRTFDHLYCMPASSAQL